MARNTRLVLLIFCVTSWWTESQGQACGAGKYYREDAEECVRCQAGRYREQNNHSFTRCLDCDLGFAENSGGAIQCEPCPVGLYAPSPGLLNCEVCPNPMTTSAPGSSVCSEKCPTGKASFRDLEACSTCLPGLYSDEVGLSECKQCPSGTFQDAEGQTYCMSCLDGLSSLVQATECNPCPEGSYCQGGKDLLCTQGKYQDLTGQSVCKSCPIGKFNSLIGSSICENCQIGRYLDVEGQIECKKCGVGTYAANTGTTVCTTCAAGLEARNVGQTVCTDCRPGRYNDGVSELSRSECALCPLDTKMPDTGASACIPCEEGTDSGDSMGALSCQGCPAGEYGDGEGCTKCVPGKFSSKGATACRDCPDGRFNAEHGEQHCPGCMPGFYNDVGGMTACKECPLGLYQAEWSTSTCNECSRGKFQDELGKTACKECDPGLYLGSTGATKCTACAEGTFNDLASASACSDCYEGTFSSDAGVTVCTMCSPGTVSTSGQTACTACEVGKFIDEEPFTQCFGCPAGRYSDVEGLSICKACGPGTTAAEIGQQQCDGCEVGKVTAQAESFMCDKCGVGYYMDEIGQSSCFECSPGLYMTESGQSDCQTCGTGKYQDEPAQIFCKLCLPGYNSAVEGASACTACLPGFFSPQTGRENCMICDPGKYQDESAKLECKACEDGTYQRLLGATACVKCPIGQSRDYSQPETTSCYNCTAGRFADTEGNYFCTECPGGKYGTEAGMTDCMTCPIGSVSSDIEGATSCIECAEKYVPHENGWECIPESACAAGSHKADPKDDRSVCIECEINFFKAYSGTDRCEQCVPGRFSSIPGQTTCQNCAGGKYSTNVDMDCSPCEKGWFSTPGSTTCEQCPVGFFGPKSSMSACELCAPGRYQNDTGSSRCLDCDEGYISWDEGFNLCEPCELGSHALFTGLTECSDCVAGYYQDEMGQKTCKACEVGKYLPLASTPRVSPDQCLPCVAGRYAQTTAMSHCDHCAPAYQPEEGSNSCIQCPANSWTVSTTTQLGTGDVVTGSSVSIDDCFCMPGAFGTGNSCVPCPEATTCDETGSVRPTPNPGFWLHPDDPNTVIECSPKEACALASSLDDFDPDLDTGKGETLCAFGYEGSACGTCRSTAPKYYRFNNECLACPDTKPVSYFMIFMLIIFILFILPAVVKILRALFSMGRAGNFTALAELTAFMSVSVNFFQNLAIFKSLDLEWPGNIQWLFDIFSVFNFNLELLRPECQVDISYTRKWLATQSLPAVFVTRQLVIMLWCLMWYAFTGKRVVGSTPTGDLRKGSKLLPGKGWTWSQTKHFFQSCLGLALGVSNFLYLQVSESTLSIFNCHENMDGNSYMVVAPQIQCSLDNPEYKDLYTMAWISTIVYVIGVPATIITLFIWHRNEIDREHTHRKIGMLTQRYERSWFWFELVVMLRKASLANLANVLGFRSAIAQSCLNLAILYFAVTLQAYARPYRSTNIDRCESLIGVVLFTTLVAGLLFKSFLLSNEEKGVLGWLVFSIILLAVGAIPVFLILEIRQKEKRVQYTKDGRANEIPDNHAVHLIYAEDKAKRIPAKHLHAVLEPSDQRKLRDMSQQFAKMMRAVEALEDKSAEAQKNKKIKKRQKEYDKLMKAQQKLEKKLEAQVQLRKKRQKKVTQSAVSKVKKAARKLGMLPRAAKARNEQGEVINKRLKDEAVFVAAPKMKRPVSRRDPTTYALIPTDDPDAATSGDDGVGESLQDLPTIALPQEESVEDPKQKTPKPTAQQVAAVRAKTPSPENVPPTAGDRPPDPPPEEPEPAAGKIEIPPDYPHSRKGFVQLFLAIKREMVGQSAIRNVSAFKLYQDSVDQHISPSEWPTFIRNSLLM